MDKIVNNQIAASEVILIDCDGKNLGKFSKREALEIAGKSNLDLVQMTGDSVPVCKILDYSKMEYDERKKQKHNKNLNSEKFKEVRFRTSICEHDLNTKVSHINDFLVKGFRIQVAIQLINRRNNSGEVAKELMGNILRKLNAPYKFSSQPSLRGNFYSSTICSDLKK